MSTAKDQVKSHIDEASAYIDPFFFLRLKVCLTKGLSLPSGTVQHTRLISVLDDLDWADNAYRQCSTRLRSLVAEREKKLEDIEKIEKATKKEYKEWRSIENSKVRQLFAKARKGQEALEARISKEEKEYLESFAQERKAKDELGILEAELKEVETMEADLRDKSSQHAEAKGQLDRLYKIIFTGNTPDFPQEDETERQLESASVTYNEAQELLNKESSALGALKRADTRLEQCMKSLQEAAQYSYDNALGLSRWVELLTRDALADGRRYQLAAEMLNRDARNAQRQVPPLRRMDLVDPNYFSGAFITGGPELAQKILVSREQVRLARHELRTVGIAESEARLANLRQFCRDQTRQLRGLRENLWRVRRRIFEEQTAIRDLGEAPAYESQGPSSGPGQFQVPEVVEPSTSSLTSADSSYASIAPSASPIPARVLSAAIPASGRRSRPVSSSNPYADAMAAARTETTLRFLPDDDSSYTSTENNAAQEMPPAYSRRSQLGP